MSFYCFYLEKSYVTVKLHNNAMVNHLQFLTLVYLPMVKYSNLQLSNLKFGNVAFHTILL